MHLLCYVVAVVAIVIVYKVILQIIGLPEVNICCAKVCGQGGAGPKCTFRFTSLNVDRVIVIVTLKEL